MVGVCEYDNEYPRVLENWEFLDHTRSYLVKKFIIPCS
jgi:hypothetical protein